MVRLKSNGIKKIMFKSRLSLSNIKVSAATPAATTNVCACWDIGYLRSFLKKAYFYGKIN